MGTRQDANGVTFLKDLDTGHVVGLRQPDGTETFFRTGESTTDVATPLLGGGDHFDGLAAALDVAEASYGLLLVSDSLGDQTTDFFYRWVNENLLPRTDMRIEYRAWNTTSQVYDPPSVLQAGANGERRLVFTGSTFRSLQVAEVATRTVAADLEVEIKLSMADWTPASGVRLVGQYGSAGQRSWYVHIQAGGWVNFTYSANGTDGFTAFSASKTDFTDGDTGYIRVKFDGDNGAGSNTTTFEKSTDGVNWTNIGTVLGSATSPANNATTTIKTDATSTYQVGAVSGAGPLTGSVYSVTIRDGFDGPIINPVNIDAWAADSDDGATYRDAEIQGTPTLYVFQGAASGQSLSYFDDSTRRPKMCPYVTAMTVLACTNHNDAAFRPGRVASSTWATFISNLRSRLPGSQIAMINENPRNEGVEFGRGFSYMVHARARQMAGIAQQNNVGFIDTAAAFLRAVAGKEASLTDLVGDGVHPTNGGGVDTFIAAVDKPFARRRYG